MTETKKVHLRFHDYPSLLEEIRKRPQMYLGGDERNLESLATLLDGFKMAEWFHALPEAQHMGGFDWESYESWVKRKYNPKRLSLNSMPLAVYISDSSADAFDLWFSWYDEYSELHGD
jgi:hypothetical protein